MKTITMTLDVRSINKAIKELESYKKDIERKSNEICERLMSLGAMTVSQRFAQVVPFVSDTGGRDYEISVTNDGKTWTLTAGGTEVLFLEFGSGSRYGYGHPDNLGYGPGTYPGKGHWDQPQGWWTPQGQHSYGNPPAMGFYAARIEMMEALVEIAEEILKWLTTHPPQSTHM